MILKVKNKEFETINKIPIFNKRNLKRFSSKNEETVWEYFVLVKAKLTMIFKKNTKSHLHYLKKNI